MIAASSYFYRMIIFLHAFSDWTYMSGNRIEKHLDELDGVVAKVNLNKKQAVVSIYREIDDSVIRDVIEGLDFTVVSMEQK